MTVATTTLPFPAAHRLGAKVWEELRKNSDLLAKTDKLRLDIKAAGDVTGTGSARTIVSGGVGAPAGMALGVQQRLHRPQHRRYLAPSSIQPLYRPRGRRRGASRRRRRQGSRSPDVLPDQQAALTIAGYSKISKQALNDQSELTRAIDVTLRRSIGKALDTLLNSGSWGGAAGLLAHATAYTCWSIPAWLMQPAKAWRRCRRLVMPDTVVLKPADWLAITTATATGGEYLSGAYLSPLPELLRGLKVVLCPTVTAGKVMVADSSQFELLIVEDLAVEIGTDADDFTSNVRTILGEMRVIPTFRAVGAARLITPKA